MVADEIPDRIPEADLILYLNTAGISNSQTQIPVFSETCLFGVSVKTVSRKSLGKASEAVILAEAGDPEIRKAAENFRFRKEFPRTGLVMTAGNETREEKEYGKVMAEILWMSHKTGKENGMLLLPKRRRKVSMGDVEAVRQLCSVLKKEEETDENHRICTNEIEE